MILHIQTGTLHINAFFFVLTVSWKVTNIRDLNVEEGSRPCRSIS